ncbi:MAG: adenylate kinase [Dehalococcoidia bacterium]|nr:MAG: adenylate kinase [Dehalococcoidia bacterium]
MLGAPGAGKGTQAVNIARKMKLGHIASGDLFRQMIKKGDELGGKVKEYMGKGTLVPDKVTIKMILQRLALDDSKNGALLDGFPRNIKQARALDRALKDQGKFIDKALYIEVSEGELNRRLTNRALCRRCQTPYQNGDRSIGDEEKCKCCGGELYRRADDNLETIKKRLDVYFSETMPVIEYYKKQGKLVEINGEGSVEVITARIFNALQKHEFIAK